MFEQELAYYNENKESLLQHYKNQYVVIKERRLIGAFTTEQEAYEAGLRELGSVAFLIKRVLEEEEVVRFPALSLGAINADL